MKKYFVVDLATGQKYGPADTNVLNQWLAEGRLSAQSTLEDAETGERIQAAYVDGLSVGPTPPSSPPQAGAPMNSPYPRAGVEGTAYSQYPPGIYFEFIGRSWNYIKPNLGLWIAAVIIYYMIAGITSYPMSFVANIVGYGSAIPLGPMTNVPGYILVTLLSYLIQFAVLGPLTAGMVSFALDQIDGKPADISSMFRPFKRLGQNVIGSLAYYFAVAIGCCLCIVPGLYLLGRLAFVNVLITEEGLTASEALNKSWAVMAPYAWAMFGLYFVASLVSALGMCACGIGILFTAPFLFVTMAQQYRVLFPKSVAPIGAAGPTGYMP